MKKITLLFVFVSSIAYGQNLANTQTVGQPSRNQRAGNGLQVEDTTLLKGVVWLPAVSTLGAGTDSILSIDPSTNLVELRPQFDSTGLSNRINLKVDSVKRKAASDSVFYYTNGTPHFAFTDSTGGAVINVSDSAWSLTGNAGTSAVTNYMGTKDSVAVVINANRNGVSAYKFPFTFYPSGRLDMGDGDFHNTVIGNHAGENFVGDLVNFHSHVLIGHSAGQNIGTVPGGCIQNTFVGGYAGKANTSGQFNTFIGDQAGLVNTTASYNTFIGWQPGHAITTGEFNTMLGAAAGYSSIDVTRCTFVGMQSAYYNVSGTDFSTLGYHAGLAQTGSFGTYIGSEAGNGSVGSSTGSNHTMVGAGAGRSVQGGEKNTNVGMQSMYYNTGGSNNTTLGYHNALNTQGDNNTSAGFESLLTNTTGSNNACFGAHAGRYGIFSNHVWIDVLNRTDSANQRREALIRIVANADSSLQTGQHNYKMGIYTNPTEALDVLGSVKIVDGTQGTDKVLTSDASGKGRWGSVLQDDTLSVTAFAVINIDSVSILGGQWERNDSTITVSGVYVVDADSIGIVEFEMTLPVASDFTQIWQLAGTAFDIESEVGETPEGAGIYADIADNRAAVRSYSAHVDLHKHSFHFTYRLK